MSDIYKSDTIIIRIIVKWFGWLYLLDEWIFLTVPKIYSGIFLDTGFENHCHRLHFDICYHVFQPLSWTPFAISEGELIYVVSILESSACDWHVFCLSVLTDILFNSVVRVVQCVCVCVQHTLLCWCLFKLTLSL
jgi:hypothetical protein